MTHLELANRLAAASAVLSQLAEKDGTVKELLRYRQALETIAELPPHREDEGHLIARKALRWEE